MLCSATDERARVWHVGSQRPDPGTVVLHIDPSLAQAQTAQNDCNTASEDIIVIHSFWSRPLHADVVQVGFANSKLSFPAREHYVQPYRRTNLQTSTRNMMLRDRSSSQALQIYRKTDSNTANL